MEYKPLSRLLGMLLRGRLSLFLNANHLADRSGYFLASQVLSAAADVVWSGKQPDKRLQQWEVTVANMVRAVESSYSVDSQTHRYDMLLSPQATQWVVRACHSHHKDLKAHIDDAHLPFLPQRHRGCARSRSPRGKGRKRH